MQSKVRPILFLAMVTWSVMSPAPIYSSESSALKKITSNTLAAGFVVAIAYWCALRYVQMWFTIPKIKKELTAYNTGATPYDTNQPATQKLKTAIDQLLPLGNFLRWWTGDNFFTWLELEISDGDYDYQASQCSLCKDVKASGKKPCNKHSQKAYQKRIEEKYESSFWAYWQPSLVDAIILNRNISELEKSARL